MGKKLLTAEQLAKELRGGVDTVVAFEQTKKEKMKLQSQQVRWYRDRNIQAALIIAAITVVGWFVNPYINKQVTSPQKNVSTSPNVETRGNLSPAFVTGPNSIVNINNNYLTPSQSETGSEVKEMDVNRPK